MTFFTSVIALFNSRTSIWFFLITVLSLLLFPSWCDIFIIPSFTSLIVVSFCSLDLFITAALNSLSNLTSGCNHSQFLLLTYSYFPGCFFFFVCFYYFFVLVWKPDLPTIVRLLRYVKYYSNSGYWTILPLPRFVIAICLFSCLVSGWFILVESVFTPYSPPSLTLHPSCVMLQLLLLRESRLGYAHCHPGMSAFGRALFVSFPDQTQLFGPTNWGLLLLYSAVPWQCCFII